jgi:hypothetical protein
MRSPPRGCCRTDTPCKNTNRSDRDTPAKHAGFVASGSTTVRTGNVTIYAGKGVVKYSW